MVTCSLTATLVTPGILGVTGPVNTSLGTPSTVSHSCTGLQYCQLLLSLDQLSDSVWTREERRVERRQTASIVPVFHPAL